MGNCVFRGFGGDAEVEKMVKVVTSNGGIMELYAPITAGCITNEFPGHGIFCRDDMFLSLSAPLLHNQHLRPGQVYYLLPLNNTYTYTESSTFTSTTTTSGSRGRLSSFANSNKRSTSTTQSSTEQNHEDSGTNTNRNSTNRATRATCTPYRMSFDNHGMLSKRSSEAAVDPEVFPRYNSIGVWKVRLVINPEQLSEILSQESRTEALIESVRTVAKCGNSTTSTTTSGTSWVSSMAANNSDQWSVSSSWRTEQ